MDKTIEFLEKCKSLLPEDVYYPNVDWKLGELTWEIVEGDDTYKFCLRDYNVSWESTDNGKYGSGRYYKGINTPDDIGEAMERWKNEEINKWNH